MKLSLNVSLMFDGRCEEAFRFYEQCLNGTLAFMLKWGDSPAAAQAPPAWASKVYHATLKIGDTVIQGGDVSPLTPDYLRPQGFSLILQMDDAGAADRMFQALSANAAIGMPLQETFWAARFGTLVDQFGISWTVNCEKAVEAAS
jgi:PhnB protein